MSVPLPIPPPKKNPHDFILTNRREGSTSLITSKDFKDPVQDSLKEGEFPTPTNNSQTPAGYGKSQLNSDAAILKQCQSPPAESGLHWPDLPPIQVPIARSQHTCVSSQEATDEGFPQPCLFQVICYKDSELGKPFLH